MKYTRIALLISVLTTETWAQPISSVGVEQFRAPLDEMSQLSLSEKDWERHAGRDPMSIDKTMPRAELKKQFSYVVTLGEGSIKRSFNEVAVGLGFKGGLWRLDDFQVPQSRVIAGNTVESVLSQIITLSGMKGIAKIYSNKRVSIEATGEPNK